MKPIVVPFWADYTDDEIMVYALAALNDPEVLGDKAKAMLRWRLDNDKAADRDAIADARRDSWGDGMDKS